MQQQKLPVGAIIGIIAAVVVLAGFIGFTAMKKNDDSQGGVTYGGTPEEYAKRRQQQQGAGVEASVKGAILISSRPHQVDSLAWETYRAVTGDADT
jgi:hypothetical protein